MWFALVYSLFVLTARVSSVVPRLSELSVSWVNMPVRSMPIVQNFYGAATLRRDVEPGYGLISLGPITSAPYNGNFQNSSFLLNGRAYRVDTVTWAICEASREVQNEVHITNRVRMPFEDHGFMQTWDISSNSPHNTIELFLDGPFFRVCDTPMKDGKVWSSCGWGAAMPIDRKHFNLSIIENSQIMVIQDTLSETVAMTSVFVSGTNLEMSVDSERIGFIVKGEIDRKHFSVYQVAAVGVDFDAVLEKLKDQISNFDVEWRLACEKWESRWQDAFDPQNTHFSGNLPSIQTNSPELDRLYYWSALAFVSLERTNLLSIDRSFVVSEGPSNSFDGSSNMGGSGQFVWDASFGSVTFSLLDPKSARYMVEYIIKYSDITPGKLLQLPQSWDVYKESPPGVGVYCFDYVSTFLLFHQYISVTNDSDFLLQTVQNYQDPSLSVSVIEFMERIAWSWTYYNRSAVSEYLVDYGNDKRSFLEAVPTYRDVVPALQISNAAMLLSVAKLYDKLSISDEEVIKFMRGNASMIIKDVFDFQYNSGDGFFNCIMDNGKSVEVRAISDFIYAGLSLGVLSNEASLIPTDARKEMAQYFMNEILSNGWVRALSLEDPVMSNVYSLNPSVEDKLAMRADWTGTGAYGGLAGSSIDSLVDLEGGFNLAMKALKNISLVSRTSMPAQGVAVMTPPFMYNFLNGNDGLPSPIGPYAPAFPEFFDEPNFPALWPNTARSIQNAESSIVDAFIRSVFGWRPFWLSPAVQSTLDVEAAINASLHLSDISRGDDFVGELRGLRTPYGLINIIADTAGVRWSWYE
jgi:hypothetical protein